ncbi:hypothetical protein BRPE64_ACDS28000 [Caballeronia insecticola]|uniref:Uncharacterized protein n=1 Tax=Caballeronia insecticola TaxID=758793 RepID=R4WJI3_9BURK|nr:hypothetical protein BRPE64_ACDS28000 [Caballeronia insecticola]
MDPPDPVRHWQHAKRFAASRMRRLIRARPDRDAAVFVRISFRLNEPTPV